MLKIIQKQLPWLAVPAERLRVQLEEDRLTHAVLVSGPRGCGKRQLALSLAAAALRAPALVADRLALQRDPDAGTGHPDFSLLIPLKDKHTIGIDQVRELTGFLELTSHGGGPKAAVVCPADRMTRAAADSFLKTLEEPPGPVLLILVCDSLTSLPPTVRSRCQQVRCSVPERSAALEWLNDYEAGRDWGDALDFASGGPLLALLAEENGFTEQHSQFTSDIAGLGNRDLTPIAVARRWARLDTETCLRWLIWRTSSRLRSITGNPESGVGDAQYGLQTARKETSIRAYFDYLDRLLALWRLRSSGLNMELQFADLLLPWHAGFDSAKRN